MNTSRHHRAMMKVDFLQGDANLMYLKAFKTIWRMYGLSPNFIFFCFVLVFFRVWFLISHISLFADYLFFHGFTRVKVKNPVFIIGHPRSGTTFIHHLFTQTDEMASFHAWHVLFPSICERKIVSPLIRFLIRREKTEIFPKSMGHGISIDQVEEDEMLFLHNIDTQFALIGTPLGFAPDEYREFRFHDLQPRHRRLRSARYLKRCFQRHIYYTGKTQIFAQTHFSTHRVQTLMEIFPDARFIYMHRSAEKTLPSYFSLNYNTLDELWGLHRFTKEQLNVFFEYRYRASVELCRYFFDLWQSGAINREKVMILPYDRIQHELPEVFNEIIRFTGITPSPAFKEAVARQAEKQRGFQRGHSVLPLEFFGISPERVRRDFAFQGNDPLRYLRD